MTRPQGVHTTPIRRVLSVTFPLTHAMFPLVAAECVAMGVSPQDWTVRIRIGSSLVLSASRLGSNYWNELRLSYFLHIAHPKSILRQAFARGCATELLSKSLGSECHEDLRHGRSVVRQDQLVK